MNPATAPLPVVVSIPHGSVTIPDGLAGRVALDEAALFDDGDPFTVEIYDAGPHVVAVVTAEVARAICDLNRAPDDRPPQNPDGVVKTTTCHGVTVWRRPSDPTDELADVLVEAWWRPYHERLASVARSGDIAFGLDCHSMGAVAPTVAPDSGERPTFCVSDRAGTTASQAFTELVGDALAESYEVDRDSVLRNRPFAGGGIVARHGNKPVPWVQVEMNRNLYLADPWFDPGTRAVDPTRLEELNRRFVHAIGIVVDRSGEGGI